MRLHAERVRAVGHVVTFEGEQAVRVERIVGQSAVTGHERTRKVWERGHGRSPSLAANEAILAAALTREGAPPRPQLSPAQRAHLAMLVCAGAAGREAAVSIFDHPAVAGLVPGVVARLTDLGLAGARVAGHAGGRRLTVYWLTEAGLAEAQTLAAEGQHG